MHFQNNIVAVFFRTNRRFNKKDDTIIINSMNPFSEDNLIEQQLSSSSKKFGLIRRAISMHIPMKKILNFLYIRELFNYLTTIIFKHVRKRI